MLAIKLVPFDSGGVAISNVIGDFTVTYRTAKNKIEIGSTDVPELV